MVFNSQGEEMGPSQHGGFAKGPRRFLGMKTGLGAWGFLKMGVPWGPFEICRYENGTGDMRVLTRDHIRKLLRTGHLMLPQRAWGVQNRVHQI